MTKNTACKIRFCKSGAEVLKMNIYNSNAIVGRLTNNIHFDKG